MSDIKLESIVSPGLSESNYGENLSQQFENIDKNFRTIVGTDFLKGNQGDSMQVVEVEINPNDNKDLGLYLNNVAQTPAKLYNAIKNAILGDISEANEADGMLKNILTKTSKEITWLDYLNTYNKLTVIYKIDELYNRRHVISILYYTFYDARFSNIQYANSEDYNGAVDMSCVVSLQAIQNDRGESQLVFKTINAFPTLYYNEHVMDASDNMGTFCWVINGSKTEIPAIGPRGHEGKPSSVYFVKVKEGAGTNKCYITEVFVANDSTPGEFIKLEEFLKLDFAFNESTFVFAIKEPHSKELAPSVWISPLYIEKTNASTINYIAYCDSSNSIMGLFDTEMLKVAMSNIYGSANLRGLFVPISDVVTGIKDQKEFYKQPGHLLYAEPLTENGPLNNLCIAPVEDILSTTPELYKKEAILTFLYTNILFNHNIEVVGNSNIHNLNVTQSANFNCVSNFKDDVVVEDRLTLPYKTTENGEEVTRHLVEITNDPKGVKKYANGDYLVDVEDELYKIYFDDKVLFNNDITTGDIAAGSVSASSINVSGLANCQNVKSSNIDSTTLHSQLGTFEKLVSLDSTSLCKKVEITPEETNVHNDTIFHEDVIMRDSSELNFIEFHPNENIGNSNEDVAKENNAKFNEEVIEKYSPKDVTKYVVLGTGNSHTLNNTFVAQNESFYTLWEKPVFEYTNTSANDTGWFIDITEMEIAKAFDIQVWNKGNSTVVVNDDMKFKLKFPTNICVPFTVSGRNIHTEGLFKKWVEPKIEDILLKIDIIKKYNVSGKTEEIEHTLFYDASTQNKEIFTLLKDDKDYKKLYDEDSVRKNDYGDTSLFVLDAALPQKEVVIGVNGENPDTQNSNSLNMISVRFALVIKITREKGKQEKNSRYNFFRSFKVLGVLPSNTTANTGKLTLTKLGSLQDNNYTTSNENKKPLEFLSNQQSVFDNYLIKGHEQDFSCGALFYSYYSEKDSNPVYRKLHLFNDGLGMVFGNKTGVFLTNGVASYAVGDSDSPLNGQYVYDSYIRTYRLNDKSGQLEKFTISLTELIQDTGKAIQEWYCPSQDSYVTYNPDHKDDRYTNNPQEQAIYVDLWKKNPWA